MSNPDIDIEPYVVKAKREEGYVDILAGNEEGTLVHKFSISMEDKRVNDLHGWRIHFKFGAEITGQMEKQLKVVSDMFYQDITTPDFRDEFELDRHSIKLAVYDGDEFRAVGMIMDVIRGEFSDIEMK